MQQLHLRVSYGCSCAVLMHIRSAFAVVVLTVSHAALVGFVGRSVIVQQT